MNGYIVRSTNAYGFNEQTFHFWECNAKEEAEMRTARGHTGIVCTNVDTGERTTYGDAPDVGDFLTEDDGGTLREVPVA